MQKKYRQGVETCGLRAGYQDLWAISEFVYKKLLAQERGDLDRVCLLNHSFDTKKHNIDEAEKKRCRQLRKRSVSTWQQQPKSRIKHRRAESAEKCKFNYVIVLMVHYTCNFHGKNFSRKITGRFLILGLITNQNMF